MSQQNNPIVAGSIVTSDTARAGGRIRRLIVVGLVCLLIAAGLGVGGWYVWSYTSLFHKHPPAKTVDTSKLSPAEALQVAQTAVNNAHTSSEKQTAYTTLGDAYHANGQVSQSTTAYQQALTYSPDDIPLLERLSSAYEDAHDKTDAANALQKLITALSASSIQDKDFLLSRYQAELQYVQGWN